MHINLKMKNWHLDSTVEWILALIHTNELKVRNEEHLHGISSGCPVGPRRRRCPLRLVPFWTPPGRQAEVTFSNAAIDCDRSRTTGQTGGRINVWRRGNGIKANEKLKKTEIRTVWFYHASTAIVLWKWRALLFRRTILQKVHLHWYWHTSVNYQPEINM